MEDMFDDERDVEYVLEQLKQGNDAAWFCAEIKVTLYGKFTSSRFLGSCSYENFETFLKGDRCQDMIEMSAEEALEELNHVKTLIA